MDGRNSVGSNHDTTAFATRTSRQDTAPVGRLQLGFEKRGSVTCQSDEDAARTASLPFYDRARVAGIGSKLAFCARQDLAAKQS